MGVENYSNFLVKSLLYKLLNEEKVFINILRECFSLTYMYLCTL